ncbi:MAG: adenylate/guanylate cyclase domain-containing protein [Anaeromyxobacteraceae bacterium]
MDERPRERTWLCSVVFVDIVHYSAQSVTLELNWKGRLNRYLARSIEDVPENDRVILDTGDGAAICFLGDPEAAMFCALRLLDAFVKEEAGPVGMRVRIGVNVGPVKLVRDLNGNANAVGDGINVGQRVMSFAAENQILVSRSFYEVASRLSDSYLHLFRHVGVQKDKHVREHELWELLPPDAAPPAPGRTAPTSPGADRSGANGAARPPTGGAARPGPTAGAARSTPPLGAAPATPRSTPSSLDAAAVERLERRLAAHVGPIARVLVRDASARTPTALDAVRVLAEHVPGPENQARFVEELTAELALVQVAGPGATPAPGALPAASFAAPTGELLDAAALERAIRALASHVGPVAKILVSRAAPAAASEAALWAALAAHVPEGRERDAFLAGAPQG